MPESHAMEVVSDEEDSEDKEPYHHALALPPVEASSENMDDESTLIVRHGGTSSSSSEMQRRELAGPSSEQLMPLSRDIVPSRLEPGSNLRKRKSRSVSVASEDNPNDSSLGVAINDFFRPAPIRAPTSTLNTGPQVPHILTRGVITPVEAEKLFKM